MVSYNFSIEAFRAGDKVAYATVFKHFYQTLCYFAQSIIKNGPASEEIAQDSMLKLWQRHTDFERWENIKAFLYIATKNACLDYRKKELLASRNAAALESWYEGFEAEASVQLIRAEALHEIYAAVELLPDHYAKVIKLSYQEGLKEREIAERLGLPLSTISNQKARALKLLRKGLSDRSYLILIASML